MDSSTFFAFLLISRIIVQNKFNRIVGISFLQKHRSYDFVSFHC